MRLCALFMAIYLSIGACIPNSDFGQLMHIDDLAIHYSQHKAEAEAIGENITFYEFLYLHFISEDDHDHDTPTDHGSLPLQNIVSPISLFLVSHVIQDITQVLDPIIESRFARPILSYDIVETKGIFHPPKV